MTLRYGSLFAGVGGFDLGFDRAGMECAWQVEIDPFCRKVLAKHWPGVRRHDDVRTFPPTDPEGWRVDVVCGGFPCQDISSAGRKVGIGGERSGLWGEYSRIIRLLRPRYVVVENVADLLVRGLGRVLGDLAAGGYDAEWDCIPASAVGAPHRRDRLFLVAYPSGAERSEPERPRLASAGGAAAEPRERRCFGGPVGGRWAPEPGVGRVADGVPARLDRLRCLGNSVVPQVAEWIGRRIVAAEGLLT